jgi:hypothetical protein
MRGRYTRPHGRARAARSRRARRPARCRSARRVRLACPERTSRAAPDRPRRRPPASPSRRLRGVSPSRPAGAGRRCRGADALGHRGRGAEGQRAAHAVALRSDLLGAIDLPLRVEEGDERGGIALCRCRRVDRAHQGTELRARGWIREIDVRRRLELRRPRHAIEQVRNEDRVTLGGSASRWSSFMVDRGVVVTRQ